MGTKILGSVILPETLNGASSGKKSTRYSGRNIVLPSK